MASAASIYAKVLGAFAFCNAWLAIGFPYDGIIFLPANLIVGLVNYPGIWFLTKTDRGLAILKNPATDWGTTSVLLSLPGTVIWSALLFIAIVRIRKRHRTQGS